MYLISQSVEVICREASERVVGCSTIETEATSQSVEVICREASFWFEKAI